MTNAVTPAKAGAQNKEKTFWVPAFAGMTTITFLSVFCLLNSQWAHADTAAQAYNPAQLSGPLSWRQPYTPFDRVTGVQVYLEDNYLPWWQSRVAHPIADYDASKLPVGGVRLDSALDAELTTHRLLPGWSKQVSPTGINNVYTFTPGSHSQEDKTMRAGQNAFFDFGAHPIEHLSADIGAELVGNYDQRYWFPVNDEHRMYNSDKTAKIVRAEGTYDNGTLMVRGFDGVPVGSWASQNDLFYLLPDQRDVEYYRRYSGSVLPAGGEMRFQSSLGTLNVLGGSQIRWGYGSSVYAKYDAPTVGRLEQSLMYRNENIPFGLESIQEDERRWSLSYNASYLFSERVQGHWGLLYQPFRIGRPYQVGDSAASIRTQETMTRDAFGVTARTEVHPASMVDLAGLGYTYLGPTAGNKNQVDLDATRSFLGSWQALGAYQYRRPVQGPVPLLYAGTAADPGALLSSPRGPDDPFNVDWDNREAHIGSLTMVYDPTPGTPFFKHRPGLLEDWNYNAEEDAPLTAAVQYRITEYPTNTDRMWYYDENRNLVWDPIFHTGALATKHPFSSATGVLRVKLGEWRYQADLSGGEALAGSAIAYNPETTFYKPSTVYVQGGASADNGIVKLFARYGQDVWGPADYHTQFGWAYHRVYQAGITYTFLKNVQAGFRYIGTRMTDEFIGSDTAAFNEYNLYLTYHFALEHNFGSKFEKIGRALPQSFPEVHVTMSDAQFTPDGSGPVKNVSLYAQAYAESGILSWKLYIRNAKGEIVRTWEGNGVPPKGVQWDGSGADGKTLAAGTYRVTLDVVDLYGNEATSPAQPIEIRGAAPAPAAAAPAAVAVVAPRDYSVKTTDEGLRVTLNALILFDVNSFSLKESSKEGLNQVIDLLKAYPSNALRITGYTDATGTHAHNQKLSVRRAQAVADYFIQTGRIDKRRIVVVGYGERRPVASNATEEGRQQNRRVEIDILK